MRRILFVDDEPHVLDGLRDLLHKRRREWEMSFALGGQEALTLLETRPFDVVISDMRMPGIDGVTLLRLVKERYPAIARIVLSGQAERDAVVNALPVAHQFLSKPCDVEVLYAVVERACGLQGLLQDESIRNIIGKVDRLPSLPRTYLEISEAASQPDVGLADIAKIVEKDAAMAVKVLQLVNSSYFGLAQRQTSVRHAVAYLGTEMLKALALTAQVFVSATPSIPNFTLDQLQEHSLLTARIAKRFFREETLAYAAFTAGLVHDVGKIILAMGVRESFEEVVRRAPDAGGQMHRVEKELLGTSHAEVGAYLLGLWGLPFDIVEAVAYHHHPELVEPTELLIAVHVANALSQREPGEPAELEAVGKLNRAVIEGTAWEKVFPGWCALADEEIRAWRREQRN